MEAIQTQRLIDELERNLESERFVHVLGVLHTAVALAVRHGVDPEAAILAALLHDRSKPLAPEQIEADLARRGSPLAEDDRPFPAVWHGAHAALAARQDGELAGRTDAADVEQAVALHSTADAAMSPLAKVLFVADFIEPGRDFDGLDALRATARRNLETAFKEVLRAKCLHLKNRGRPMSPRALRALEAYGVQL